MVKKQVRRPDQLPVASVQYAVSSRSALAPAEALTLVRGHWSIENSLCHVKDASFGEDRHVLHNHRLGAVISLLRNLAVTMLRTTCDLWAPKEPLIGRAQRLAAHPTAAVPLVS